LSMDHGVSTTRDLGGFLRSDAGHDPVDALSGQVLEF
jgi:hypothetical protein